MKSTSLILSASLLLLIGAFFVGIGETVDKKANLNEQAKNGIDRNVTYLRVSGELARLASESKDAILMLAAARLETLATTNESSRDKTSDGDNTEAGKKKPEKANLYALAKQFAGTNTRLQSIIEASKASGKTKGARHGAIVTYERVLARSSDYYAIKFNGGETARVLVSGDGDTDLDLYVYDENGNMICSDVDSTDQTFCVWTPNWTGTFRIKIKNLGSVYNEYSLVAN